MQAWDRLGALSGVIALAGAQGVHDGLEARNGPRTFSGPFFWDFEVALNFILINIGTG